MALTFASLQKNRITFDDGSFIEGDPYTLLSNLPITITTLACANNKLTKLPPNLIHLYCHNNKLPATLFQAFLEILLNII